ncbi:CopG family ribbon-helix-helix protein [Pluralibacter gergoviae]|uniref:CopG family ribbon-helix-helix protein n=1 Tax=Pluralibacter gergoviae TaxID=61647 RepID=UPI0004F6E15C|nr:ribbon-helix-helix protein, CopG family [Pluralibacter gergoviae]AIR00067.1 CopG family transcriptional regulator [Pluralibacter gergoviae]EKV0929338.1 ribbon-helix-helix protein, CopG family [Pluralibacter gergoviae]EKV6247014.1 ribbon-helix-helix protein, CopG family [Pluralibacter gergoviae]ELC3074274.1 ribbon-helix-helix protein, CopG family [Pluralibacter gergoviae]ELD4271252.1 ribbon-helix-helix protein, CopG family [Pluralibacter gergoviae]
MADMRTITAPLPIEMAENVDRWAEKHGRTRSWLVREAVGQFLARENERDRLIREALDAVDAGQLISHEDMVAWAESLGTDKPLPPPEPRK